MKATLALLIPLVMASACGGAPAPSESPPTPSVRASASATPAPSPSSAAPSPSAAGSPLAGLVTCGDRPTLGILGAVAATATNPDGSAKNPVSSVPAASTGQVIVVVSVQGLGTGTRLSFARYLDGKFVDSRSSVIAKVTPYFYFTFTAQAGQRIATGTYQVRLYVNDTRACTMQYTVV